VNVVDADRFLCVSTTLDSNVAANALADKLLELKMAACVQIFGPVQSIYRWKGKIERAEEWVCVAKTSHTHLADIQETIVSHHSYEEPEIIATEIVGGSESYLKWLADQLD